MEKHYILSFDGGGNHCLLESMLVQRIENEFSGFLDRCHFMAGTSMGSMVAMSLAREGDPMQRIEETNQMIEDLTRLAPKSMHLLGGFSGCFPFFADNINQPYLEKFFEDQTLRDLRQNVIVTSLKLDNMPEDHDQAEIAIRHWVPTLFNNFVEHANPFMDLSLTEASLRATATPIIYPVYQGYVDGAMFANNPSMAALSLIIDHLRSTKGLGESIEILPNLVMLSLGSGMTNNYLETHAQRTRWGYGKWLLDPKMPLAMLQMFFSSVNLAVAAECRTILDSRQYMRINPSLNLTQNPATPPEKTFEEIRKAADSVPLDPIFEFLDHVGWI